MWCVYIECEQAGIIKPLLHSAAYTQTEAQCDLSE